MACKTLIVGRPNVGKSSLFNALLGYRRAITYEQAGTTVDSIHAQITIAGKCAILVDTPGIESEHEVIPCTGFDKPLSDVCLILFVVDGMNLTPLDRAIALTLRRLHKPILLCINKCDKKGALTSADVWELGIDETIEVSATQKKNIDAIRDWVHSHREDIGLDEPDNHLAPKGHVRIALVGRPNTGKSTFMNEALRAKSSLVSDKPLTTRDPVTATIKLSRSVTIELTDTAGLRRPRSEKTAVETYASQATVRAMRDANVVLVFLASHQPVSDQDRRILSLAERAGRPTLLVFNFWDLLPKAQQKVLFSDSEFATWIYRYRFIPLSGATGFNVQECLRDAAQLFFASQKRIPTSQLNNIIEKLILKNPPPSTHLGRAKILYASQVEKSPPTFIFFAKRPNALPKTYQTYLKNQLAKELELRSQSIKIYFRESRQGLCKSASPNR